MFNHRRILIVEDDMMLGLGLADAVEDFHGDVVGPIETVAEAMEIAKGQSFAGAILDANLADRDVTPLALMLLEKAVPFLIYTGIGLPVELAAAFPHMSVVMKPMPPEIVARQLFGQLEGVAQPRTTMPFAVSSDDDPAMVDQDRSQKIDAIVAALFGQFSGKAILVAERQMDHAQGDAYSTWSAIADRLKAYELPTGG